MNETKTLLGGQVAWANGRLVITDAAATEKIRRPALSPSTAKSLSPKSCAGRWAIEKLLPRGEENPFDPAPLGTSAHALLEDFYQLPAEERTEERLESDLRAAAYKMWPKPVDAEDVLRDKRRDWANQVRAVSATIFDMEDPRLVEVYATEMKFEHLEINGVPATGFIDRVDSTPSGGIKPLDYKSGKEPRDHKYGDDHGDQVRVYAEVAHILTGVMPEKAEVYYTKTANRVPVDLSDAAMADTLKRFKQSWNRHNRFLDKGEFTLKESALCNWCPAVNSCPVATKNGYYDKKGDAPTAVQLGIPTLRPDAVDEAVAPAPEFEISFPPDDETMSGSQTSAHMDSEAEASTLPATEILEEYTMRITEARPYDDPITAEGELDPNNYAALAAFGMTQMAVEKLHAAGRGLSGREVSSLAHTFAWVVSQAQEQWIGEGAPHHGLTLGSHSRLRGALHTVLNTLPLPFGGTEQDWAVWADKAVKRMGAIVRVSLDLFAHPVADSPWARLASDASEAKPEQASEEPAAEIVPPAPAPEPAKIRPKRAPAKPKSKPEPAVEATPEPHAETEDDMPYIDFPDTDEEYAS